MEEVQSWWEVPAVAHFCHVFRSAFKLIFFEVNELESALLDMQDSYMCLSLEKLIMNILQGFENEPVTEENWEETLDEIFSENLEEKENPLNENHNFEQLATRTKLKVLLKLCELRLDVEDAMDAIKDIAPKCMNPACLGKDAQNNSYWYFYDERLYREAGSSSNGKNLKSHKVQSIKNAPSKSKAVNTREKRTKSNPESSWSIASFCLSDWEKLIEMFSKSKNLHERTLATNMRSQLSVVQKYAQKYRQLKKRFVELAPTRASSRISKIQEKKKINEIKAQEVAEKARLQAEKEQAKKEAERKKLEIIERQKRVEDRHKAMEDRAARAKLRRIAQVMDRIDSGNDDSDDDEEEEDKEDVLIKRGQKRQASWHYQNSKYKSKNEIDSEEEDVSGNENEDEPSSDSQQKSVKRFKPEENENKQSYSNRRNQVKQLITNGQQRGLPRLKTCLENMKYKSNEESESEKEDNVLKANEDTRVSPRLQKIRQNIEIQSNLNKREDDSSCDIYSNSNNSDNHRVVHKKSLAKENSPSHTYSNRTRAIVSKNLSSRISLCKNTILQNSSDVSKWNSVFDSKGQKLHILHYSSDNLSSKRVKLRQGKTFTSFSPNLKHSVSKENQVYQPFHHKSVITYSKLSPTTIQLDFRKSSSNQQSSSWS